MALTYGFYNSVNHDRMYDAIQVSQIFDGLIEDGVYGRYKKQMWPKATGQINQIIIQSGRAWFDHTWSYNDGDYVLAMPAPDNLLDRIDAVVLDVNSNTSTRRNSFMVVTGTPSGAPEKPTLINVLDHHQHPLCYVRRHAGVQEIYNRDLTVTVGGEECPFVVGIIDNMMTIDDIVEKWEEDFSRWMTLEQAIFLEWMQHEQQSWYDNIDHNTIAWNNWFQHVQDELDGDVAGNLQNQIDRIRKFSSIYVVEHCLFVPMSGASVIGHKLRFARD